MSPTATLKPNIHFSKSLHHTALWISVKYSGTTQSSLFVGGSDQFCRDSRSHQNYASCFKSAEPIHLVKKTTRLNMFKGAVGTFVVGTGTATTFKLLSRSYIPLYTATRTFLTLSRHIWESFRFCNVRHWISI